MATVSDTSSNLDAELEKTNNFKIAESLPNKHDIKHSQKCNNF